MTSAAVYLTLGAMLMRIAERRTTKLYCMGVAMLVTLLVGASRVLGVHYPTDVASWLVGLSWAVICWLVGRAIERRSGMNKNSKRQDSFQLPSFQLGVPESFSSTVWLEAGSWQREAGS
jgi:hypothetical protein